MTIRYIMINIEAREDALRDYMTQMESFKREGKTEGEARMAKLTKCLIQNNEIEKLMEITENISLREESFKKYSIE